MTTRILRTKRKNSKKTLGLVARKRTQKRHTKDRSRAVTDPGTATAPNSKPTETPNVGATGVYVDGELNRDAPLMALIRELFEDWEGEDPVAKNGPLSLLAAAHRQASDDAELIAAAQGEGFDHSRAIERALARIESRSRIVVEIARRMMEGGAS